jgi:hypothetical protein
VTKFLPSAFRDSARARAISQIAQQGATFPHFGRAELGSLKTEESSSSACKNSDLRSVRAKVLRWIGLLTNLF